MPCHRAFIRFILCALCFLAAPSTVFAQAHDEAKGFAEAAFEAYTQGEWPRAIQLFERAIELDPHPVLMFNRARALEEAQRLPSALHSYRQLEQQVEVERVAEAASKRRQAIEATLRDQGYNPLTVTDATYRIPVNVQILTGVPEAIVYIDGRAAGKGASVLIRQSVGAHHIYVDAEGYYPFQDTIVIDEDASSFTIPLEERASLATYVAPPPGLLSIVGPASGMAVYIDGTQHSRLTPANEIRLPAGEYDVVVRHPMYTDFQARVRVEAGEEFRLTATNDYLGSDPVRVLSKRQRAGNSVMIVGGSLLAGALVTGGVAAAQAGRYNRETSSPDRESLRNQARAFAATSDVLLVTGALTAATGLTMRVVAPKARDHDFPYQERMLEIAPGSGSAPLGLSLRYRH